MSVESGPLRIGREIEELLDLRLDPERLRACEADRIRYGTWWIAPFAVGSTGALLGFRLCPGARIVDAPVAAAVRAEAVTVSSRPAHFVPMRLLERLLASTDAWLRARALAESGWEEVRRLHAALGGTEGLDELRAVVNDEGLRRAFLDPAARHAVLADARELLDPTPESAVYARYVLRTMEHDDAPAPAPDAGCWNAALASLSFVANRQERWAGSRIDGERAAAWQMMLQPPGLDSARSAFPEDALRPGGDRSRMVAVAAAHTLAMDRQAAQRPWHADPLWPAVEELARAGPEYDGADHLRAAVDLDRAGRPERAYAALVATAYWSFSARGTASPDALAAAAALARARGWRDIVEALPAGPARPPVPVVVERAEQMFDAGPGPDEREVNVVSYSLEAPPPAPPPAPPAGERRRAPRGAKEAPRPSAKKDGGKRKKPRG